MRLRSDFFVSATLRRAETGGAFAAMRKRGGAESGTIFVVVDCLDGRLALFGPASQAHYAEGASERAFTRLHAEEFTTRESVEARLDKEIRFDPDLWIIEIETRDGQPFLDLVV